MQKGGGYRSSRQDPAGNWTTRRPPDGRKEMQTAAVWSCFPFIRSGQNHLARHSERGKKTRQTEEEVGRHQGMDRQTGRQTDRQTQTVDRQIDRQTGRHRQWTDRQTDRQKLDLIVLSQWTAAKGHRQTNDRERQTLDKTENACRPTLSLKNFVSDLYYIMSVHSTMSDS